MKANVPLFPSSVNFIFALCILLFLVGHMEAPLVKAADPQIAPLLYKKNLTYEGAFIMPKGTYGGSTFNYGGSSLAYHSPSQSLFIVGHDHQQMVAEVSIPTPIVTAQEESLPEAAVLQPFTDASEGKMFTVDKDTIKIGGLLTYNNKLYGTAYSHYDANGSQTHSHFTSSLDLSIKGDAEGMYQVEAENAGFVSGYMAHIPPEWQASFGGPAITGNCCIAIVTRTSFGPAAYVFDPADVGQKSPIPASPLVYYTETNPLDLWNSTGIKFNGTTKISGIVFPNKTRSVLFIGTHGIGEWCYGGNDKCNDPMSSAQGGHAYPYAYQVWAYDSLDLLKVKNGEKFPWEVKPYKIWQFNLPFVTDPFKFPVGATYDPSTQRIFMAQYRSGKPIVIHVFKVDHDGIEPDTTPPGVPKNFTVK